MTHPAPLRLGFLHARALGPSLVDVALIIVTTDGDDDNPHSDVEVLAHTCAPPSLAPHLLGDHAPAPCDLSPQADAVRDVLSHLHDLQAIYCLGPVREALKASALGLSPIFLQSTPLPAPAVFLPPCPNPRLAQPSHELLLTLGTAALPEEALRGLLEANALQEAHACLSLAVLHKDSLPQDHAALLAKLPAMDHTLSAILAPQPDDPEDAAAALPAPDAPASTQGEAPKRSRKK